MNAAEELNSILEKEAPQILRMLSNKGKKAYFPKSGILAQTAEAKGSEFNATIGQAFEDDKTPMVLDIFKETGFPKEAFLYSPSYGRKTLRETWKEELKKKNPSLNKISLPIVTNALTHGLRLAFELFEDDKIIVPEPFWGNYRLINLGKEVLTFPLFKGTGLDLDSLRNVLKGKEKKVIVLNFPNNPSGYTPTNSEVEEIENIFKESAEHCDIVVIIDDAYFGLVYEEGIYEESLFSKLSQVHENVLAIKLDGLTKEAFVWGLRVGFMTYGFKGMKESVAKALEDKTAGMVRGTISNVSTPSQVMAEAALKNKDFERQRLEKKKILSERYGAVKKALSNENYKEHFEALPFNSGYFMCIRLKKANAENTRKKLLKDYGTGLISIGNNILRIAFSAVSKENIAGIFENIYKAVK